jgi:hypothetical protein
MTLKGSIIFSKLLIFFNYERKLIMQEATHDIVFNHLATDYLWKYFAVDEDGSGYVFEYEPVLSEHGWYSHKGKDKYVGTFDPKGWQDSLIIRLFEEFDESWLDRGDCPEWANYALIQHRGMVAVSDQKPYWCPEEQVYYHKDSARVELMENWGKFRINAKKYYTRPSKKGETKMCMEKEPKMYTKQEAAGISKNVAVATLLKHIEDGVKKSVETGLRTWLVPTSCFVPNMLDKEDFIQILVNTGYQLEELDNGDFELRWC